MIYLGVDPGMSGCIAALRYMHVPLVKPLGFQFIPFSGTSRSEILEELFKMQCQEPTIALIERVHAMPKQGVTSMFTFGMAYERAMMALTACRIPFDEIQPKEWQAIVGIIPKKGWTRKERKNALKQRAQELFPNEKVNLTNADAILLAEACRRRQNHG